MFDGYGHVVKWDLIKVTHEQVLGLCLSRRVEAFLFRHECRGDDDCALQDAPALDVRAYISYSL